MHDCCGSVSADSRPRRAPASDDGLSHARDASPPRGHADIRATPPESPPPRLSHSPESDDDDEADVLSRRHHVSAASPSFPALSWSIRHPQSAGSYSSWRSTGWDEGSQSVNPASEVADSLRTRTRAYTDGGEVRIMAQQPERKMEGALPDDDGMLGLRRKLQEIRLLAVSTEEKAKQMHHLMTQDYLSRRADLDAGDESEERSSFFAPPVDPNNPYNVQPEDFEPTFSPLPTSPRESRHGTDEVVEDDALPMLGCRHYKRNVKVQCFDCRRWFPCRHCHDQAHDLPFPHQLNRKKTQNMLCMLCKTPQPAAEICAYCEEYSAWYYCSKCKLWDNDSNRRIYHCDDCGICRVGEGLGKDFVHCRRCNVCISISTSADHPCIERATEGDCPLCLVRLFESPTPVVSLPCGHYMHGECYRDLMAVTYKCPVCSKSAVNMHVQWRKLDDEIEAQPMPEDDEDLEGLLPHAESLRIEDSVPADGQGTTAQNPNLHPRRPRTVWVGCNDCGSRSWTPFHWLGLKCQVCDSYNTNQMAPTAQRETEAERVIRQQQQHHHRQHDFTGNSVLQDAGIGAINDAVVRIDSNNALQVPTSPSQTPTRPRSPPPSGAQSLGRYFVRDTDQPRRPSFTRTHFSTPTLPDMPLLPRMPDWPNLPNLRDMPSPYEMLDAVSRSLSPMRYYLQGLDVSDREMLRGVVAGERGKSPSGLSVRSDPLAGAARCRSRKGEVHLEVPGVAKGEEGEGVEFDEAAVLWSSEGDDDDDDSICAVGRGGDESSSSDSESEVEEAVVDEDEGGDDGMELFGHR